MTGVEVAAGITAFATLTAPQLTEFVKKKLNEERVSLAVLHEMLQNGTERLLALEKDRDVTVSSRSDQNDPSHVYQNWKNRLSKLKAVADELKPQYEKVKKKKWSRWKKRRGVKKEIRDALKELAELAEKYEDMNLVIDKLPEKVIKENDVPSIAEYETLKKALDRIMELLQDEEVKCVALTGRKGVGKTTIMQHLNNHSDTDKKFDMVIFIKAGDEEKADAGKTEEGQIVQKIADRVKVVGKNGDKSQVARGIRRVLEDKRYLLILDGIRYARALDKILGMLEISNHKKNSKVVIATHYPLVSEFKYVKKKPVELKPLSSKEAWEMFRNIIGDEILRKHPPNAQLICEKLCFCLPILIAPVAKSIKYLEDPIDWGRHLEEGTLLPNLEVDGLDEIYSSLESCYRVLRDTSTQKCFLYAALYPTNSQIFTDSFVECCIVQGFLGDGDGAAPANKYSTQRKTTVDVKLRHLINVAFLEEGEQMRYVKMNGLYRQLALYISSNDPSPECKICVDKGQASTSNSWESARWVSFVESKRNSLPAASQTSGSLQIQTLFLQNMRLSNIPDARFACMGNLLVLNLNGTTIERLPSLLGLTSLKAFYLNGCSNLSVQSHEIQSLQHHLQVFDIRGTGANFVPCLESLWCLKISYIRNNNVYGISELPKLEELTIEGCNQTSNNLQDAVIVFKVPLFWGPLRVGRFSLLHTLILNNASIVFEVAVDDFPELQNLVVQDCSRIKILIEVPQLEIDILPKLKMLVLENLSNINSICSNEHLAWSSLEKIHVRNCPELKALPFNTTNATNLRVIEGENQWWSNLRWTHPDVSGRLESAFLAFA